MQKLSSMDARGCTSAVAVVLVLTCASVAGAQLIPAPTIALSTDHGAPGATITVSGALPPGPPAAGVRVQWLLSTATEPVVEVAPSGGGYVADVVVPSMASAGSAVICAA